MGQPGGAQKTLPPTSPCSDYAAAPALARSNGEHTARRGSYPLRASAAAAPQPFALRFVLRTHEFLPVRLGSLASQAARTAPPPSVVPDCYCYGTKTTRASRQQRIAGARHGSLSLQAAASNAELLTPR